jgi:hypothetical protein
VSRDLYLTVVAKQGWPSPSRVEFETLYAQLGEFESSRVNSDSNSGVSTRVELELGQHCHQINLEIKYKTSRNYFNFSVQKCRVRICKANHKYVSEYAAN